MAWFRAQSPVRDEERLWIDEQLDWLTGQFGEERLRGEVVLPTDDYFPGSYEGTREDIREVLTRLSDHMGVDHRAIDLHFYSRVKGEVVWDADASGIAADSSWIDGSGVYRRVDGRSVVAIDEGEVRDAMSLVATVAHELGHVLLRGNNRIVEGRADEEPLTDVLTVYFGLGIFSANAALQIYQRTPERFAINNAAHGRRSGYLTEPMYGYALARYAWLRDETEPGWARYLDTNPRTYLKRGLRYLRQAERSS
jgi:hypothetical protein